MSRTKYSIPIYFGYLIIVFTDDIQKVSDKYQLGLNDQDYSAFVKEKSTKRGVSRYFIIFNKSEVTHSIIAHEVVHCAHWIFSDRCVKADLLNDEPLAYLVGWITNRVYKAASKYKIKP